MQWPSERKVDGLYRGWWERLAGRQLGVGDFAVVTNVPSWSAGRRVARKELHRCGDPTTARALQKEVHVARMAAQAGVGPQVLRYDPQRCQVDFELLTGPTLRALALGRGSLDEGHQAALLDLIDRMVAAKIEHTDFHANNVVYSADESTCLAIDFGGCRAGVDFERGGSVDLAKAHLLFGVLYNTANGLVEKGILRETPRLLLNRLVAWGMTPPGRRKRGAEVGTPRPPRETSRTRGERSAREGSRGRPKKKD